MKPEFHEDYLGEQDPLDSSTQDFDWDALFQILGESQNELEPRDYDALCHALRQIFRWLLTPDLTKPGSEVLLARRVIALAWTLNPGYFQSSPSLSEIARWIGTHKALLSNYAASASRTFHVRNRAQAHGWNFVRPKKRRKRGKKAQGKPAKAVTTEPTLPLEDRSAA